MFISVNVFLIAALTLINPAVSLNCCGCTYRDYDKCASNKTLGSFNLNSSFHGNKNSLSELNNFFPPAVESRPWFELEEIQIWNVNDDDFRYKYCLFLKVGVSEKNYTIRYCSAAEITGTNLCTHMSVQQLPKTSSGFTVLRGYSALDCSTCKKILCNTVIIFMVSSPNLLIGLTLINSFLVLVLIKFR